MTPAKLAQHAAAAGADQEPFLDQIGLDDVFQRVAGFGQGRGEGFDADGPAGMVIREAEQIAAVHRIEAGMVDIQFRQRGVSGGFVDAGETGDGGKITDAAGEAAGDARRAAGAAGDFGGALGRE